MWVFILDISGVLGQGLTQHSWPGILFLMTTLFVGERTFSYRIRQGWMLQSRWTRAVPIWSKKCFCCCCCYFGVPMKIPFSAKLIPGAEGEFLLEKECDLSSSLYNKWNDFSWSFASMKDRAFQKYSSFCLWFSVWTFRWFCLFVFHILSFSDSFHWWFWRKDQLLWNMQVKPRSVLYLT